MSICAPAVIYVVCGLFEYLNECVSEFYLLCAFVFICFHAPSPCLCLHIHITKKKVYVCMCVSFGACSGSVMEDLLFTAGEVCLGKEFFLTQVRHKQTEIRNTSSPSPDRFHTATGVVQGL